MILQKVYRLIKNRSFTVTIKAVIYAVFDALRLKTFFIDSSPTWRCGYRTCWRIPTRTRIMAAFYRRLGQEDEDFRRRATTAATSEMAIDVEDRTSIFLAGEDALADNSVRSFLLTKAASGNLHIVYPGNVDMPPLGMITVLTGVEVNADGQACLLQLYRLGIAFDWLSTSTEVALKEVPLYEACTRQAIPEKDGSGIKFVDITVPLEPVFHLPARFIQHRPLRILTYRWHVPHQYELYKLNAEFTLISDLGEASCRWWDLGQRPLPKNVLFKNWREIDPSQFDLAILHFDENVLHASEDACSIGGGWGATFRFLHDNLNIPRIAVCHGTPPLSDCSVVACEGRQALIDFLGETAVVVNSYQAMTEWEFRNSLVIWQGFDPDEFPCRPQHTGYHPRILTLPREAYAERPAYRGADLLEQVGCKLAAQLESLRVAEPNLLLWGNNYAKAKFAHYIAALHEFDIYFNPTLHSPMPRSRGEAMLCGLTTVNAYSHDVDRFIDNGVNGFFATTAEELADNLNFLLANPHRSETMGLAGRETAMRLFHIERYLDDWRQLIRQVLGSHAI